MARKSRMLSKSAFDCSHVKSVRAWAILHDGKGERGSDANAGRIVANFSDNPNGSVCTLTLHFWGGPLEIMPGTTGQAGGYGYDKFSAAMSDALSRAYGLEPEALQFPPSEHLPNGIPYFPSTSDVAAWGVLKARKLNTLPTKKGGWSDMSGVGESAVKSFLEAHGYTVVSVI